MKTCKRKSESCKERVSARVPARRMPALYAVWRPEVHTLSAKTSIQCRVAGSWGCGMGVLCTRTPAVFPNTRYFTVSAQALQEENSVTFPSPELGEGSSLETSGPRARVRCVLGYKKRGRRWRATHAVPTRYTRGTHARALQWR